MNHVHFIGIGGIGISALSGILLKKRARISGTDMQSSQIINQLSAAGAKIHIGHGAGNIPQNVDAVVYSLAIPPSNVELKEARKRKIPVLSYPEAIGKLTKEFFAIAVSGTHGKSTVTAMIAKILIENNLAPNVIVGAQLKKLGNKNFAVGKNKLLVLEACEYKKAFLHYIPKIAVIHTLDLDHTDCYRDFDDYLRAFGQFALKVPKDGYVFANLDDEDIHRILQTLQKNKFPPYNIFTYSAGFSHADYYLQDKTIAHKEQKSGPLRLKIPGAHNRINALAAFAVCNALGIPPKSILKSLNSYKGASRRFEFKGKIGRTIVIDDYAHHPEEIKATLQACREMFGSKKIAVVFQPHQYNRTKNLLREFGSAFNQADEVIIPNIYGVRDSEQDLKSIQTSDLVEEIGKNMPRVIDGRGFENTIAYLKKNGKKFNVILTMGAGNVWKIAKNLTS